MGRLTQQKWQKLLLRPTMAPGAASLADALRQSEGMAMDREVVNCADRPRRLVLHGNCNCGHIAALYRLHGERNRSGSPDQQ